MYLFIGIKSAMPRGLPALDLWVITLQSTRPRYLLLYYIIVQHNFHAWFCVMKEVLGLNLTFVSDIELLMSAIKKYNTWHNIDSYIYTADNTSKTKRRLTIVEDKVTVA